MTLSDSYKKGDVVLAPFPYQDDPNKEKTRPVVILTQALSGNGFLAVAQKPRSN